MDAAGRDTFAVSHAAGNSGVTAAPETSDNSLQLQLIGTRASARSGSEPKKKSISAKIKNLAFFEMLSDYDGFNVIKAV